MSRRGEAGEQEREQTRYEHGDGHAERLNERRQGGGRARTDAEDGEIRRDAERALRHQRQPEAREQRCPREARSARSTAARSTAARSTAAGTRAAALRARRHTHRAAGARTSKTAD